MLPKEKIIVDYSTNNATAGLKIAVEGQGTGSAFAVYNCLGSHNTIEIPISNNGKDKWGYYFKEGNPNILENFEGAEAAAYALPINDVIINIVPQVQFTGKVTINSITLVEKENA